MRRVAAERLEALELPFRLDAFGDHRNSEVAPHVDHSAHDGARRAILLEGADEGPVDLEFVELKFLQIVQRGMSGAEIVERDLRAELPQMVKGISRQSVVAQKHGFGDLEHEAARRQPRRRDRAQLLLPYFVGVFYFRHMRELIEKGNIYIAQPPLYRVKRGKMDRYIRDEREFARELMKRATERHAVKGKNGKSLEGADLTTFLLNIQEYDQVAAKLGRRLREPKLVDLLAESELDKKADFADKRNCRNS